MIDSRMVVGLLWLLLAPNVGAAPATCRACACANNNTVLSANSSDVNLLDMISNRTKREVEAERSSEGVDRRPCGGGWPWETIFIALAVALIPCALCALLACTCYCGPEDSRVKMPEGGVLASVGSKRRERSEELELEYRDGYVQRKDSKMTKFSMTVQYIEPRRQSMWSTGESSVPTSPIHKSPSSDSLKKTRFSDCVEVVEQPR